VPTDPSTGSGSALSEVERADRRSHLAASIVALLAAVSAWLSAGLVLIGDTGRIAALPSISILLALIVAALAAARIARLRLDQAWPLAISLLLWLPYLPLPIPDALLIWEGPIETIVWLVVGIGLIAAGGAKVPSAVMNPRIAPWIVAAIVAIDALVVFSQVRNVIPGGDEPHYLAATQSLLHDGDLRIANNYEKGEYLEYFPGRLEPHYLRRSTAGEIYSIHSPGVSVIILPAFAIAGYVGAVLTMIAFAAATAMVAWRLAFQITKSGTAAWAGVAGVAYSAPYFFHSFTIYPEIIGGCCVLVGVWTLVELTNGRDPDVRWLVVTGSAMAVLPWLHSRFAVLAGIIGALIGARLAVRQHAIKRMTAFLAVPLVAGAAWFAFFYAIWGSASPMAPYGPDTSTSASYVLRGLIGLLFDQQFGVLTTAPIYVVAIAGAASLLRTHPRLTIELSLIVIPYVVIVASYAMWWAGNAAPARFVVSILPLAALPIAAGVARSRAIRPLTLVLLAISAALLLPRAFEDGGRFIYNNRSGVDATLHWLSSSVDLPLAFPSVHRDGGSIAARDGVIWLAGFAIVFVAVAQRARAWSRGKQYALTAVVMAVVMMVCAQVSWGAGPALEPMRSRLSAFNRFRPGWQTTIVDLPSVHVRAAQELMDRMAFVIRGSDLRLEMVPAGEYIVSSPSVSPSATLRVAVGRNDGPIAQPAFDDLRNSLTPFHLRLPVMARTLALSVQPASDVEIAVRPAGVIAPDSSHAAIRAARYDHARAFFFDEWLYPERDGFWTRADGSAMVVLDTDEGSRLSGLPISITAGAVPTMISLSVGSWSESFTLAAGQKQDVMLPPARQGVWPLRIRSGAGFRPSEREPGNRDVRNLAAWIAIH
jgi:hypothetical protein